jgi:LPS-assembly lipoprotein
MWWFDMPVRRVGTRLAAAGACAFLLALPGCGFQPLYGVSGSGQSSTTDDLAAVRVLPLSDRIGQQFHNLLIDRLNPKGQSRRPDYALEVKLTKTINKVAIRKDETASRANMILRASFILRDQATTEALLRGDLRSINSYNILDSQFPTYVSEADSVERGLRELSDDLRVRLAVYFSGRRDVTVSQQGEIAN